MSVTEAAWAKTACILCECNCGIEVELDGRRLARIRGDKEHPGTHGYTCNKAMRLDHYQNGRHRLTTPLRRRGDGSFEEIDWDTAIREVAQRCSAIRDAHGGETILYYGGGGQGNHLGGSYSGAFLRALGSRYRSGALAQEKTGEAWVEHRMYGAHTRGEFEHAEVAVFIGKNPWMSQSFPRARVVLKEIAKDPARSMIVIDPVLTDTAKLSDFHLRVRPGTDAWCLAAMVAVIVQEDLVDGEFLAARVSGSEPVLEAFANVDVARYCDYCGIDEDLIRASARRIASAESVSAFEDLGIQQSPHSTLCSYINRLLWILTGNFGNPGGMHLHTSFVNLFRDPRIRRTPVTGAPIIGGLVPCNVIPDEILTDHQDRFRAMIVESANPAHSLADSQRFAEAFEALELVVVIDVALTETARHADYVLPAASQYEKPEATYFNFEFPDNTFQLRHSLMEPLPGTLPEAEIWSRLVRELDFCRRGRLEPLRAAAGRVAGLRAGVREGEHRQSRSLQRGPRRPVRDARSGTAGRPGECRRTLGTRAPMRDDLPRRGPPRWSRGRQCAVRGDPELAIRGRVHPRRVRRRLRPDRPPRRPDRARAAGDARRPGGDRRGAGHSHNRSAADRALRRRASLVHGQRHLP